MTQTAGAPALVALSQKLHQDGFVFARAAETAEVLGPEALAGWDRFAASWDSLGMDTYMADGGRYRRRRHGAFSVSAAGTRRKAHQPHYQSRDYNALNGGIARWFTPLDEAVAAGAAMQGILRRCFDLFDGLTDPAVRPDSWHVETHQFRIEARPDVAGKPTPEGMHRDGVDWVLVLLVRRENIDSGMTTIHDLGKTLLGSFTLTDPLDAALVDDNRVYHGVTPVAPLDPARPAYRDVLVVTFRRE
jgi:hypothetical protein